MCGQFEQSVEVSDHFDIIFEVCLEHQSKIQYLTVVRFSPFALKDTPNLRGATFAKFGFFRSN